jgi:hypothetical protein
MCVLLDYSRTQFERLAANGVVKARAPNCWPVIETFQKLLRYARDERRNNTKTASQSRVQLARVKEIELRVAQKSHKLIEEDEAEALVDDIFGNLRSEFSGLPAMCTRDLKMRDEIEKNVNDIFNRITQRLKLQVEMLQKSGETATRPVSLDS